MTEETKTNPTPKSKPVKIEEDIKTLSAPATSRVHHRLDAAQKVTPLDKSGLIRLAVRLMIAEYYKGNGRWEFPANMKREMLAATSSEFMDIDLPE